MAPPSKKDKKKFEGPNERNRSQPCLQVFFAKQIKLKTCTICTEQFATGLFEAHRRECKVKDDDDECQIVFTQTAEERYARDMIIIDGENDPSTSNTVTPQTRKRAPKRRIKLDIKDEEEWNKEKDESIEDTLETRTSPIKLRRSTRISRGGQDSVESSGPSSNESLMYPLSSSSMEVETGAVSDEIGDTPPPVENNEEMERTIIDNERNEEEDKKKKEEEKKRKEEEEEKKKIEEEEEKKKKEEKDEMREERRKKRQEKNKKKEEEENERKRRSEEMKNNENRKKLDEEKKNKEKEDEEREKAKSIPITGMTKMILRILEDKVTRHEMGMIPSQELVNAPVIQLEEDNPELVPHYVYLLCKIMRRVLSIRSFNGQIHDESFWGEDLRLLSRFLNLKDRTKLLFIRLFTRKRGWHLPEKLKEKYFYMKDHMDESLEEMVKEGLMENGKSGLIDTKETLRLMDVKGLRELAKKFKVDHNKPKNELIRSLLDSSSTQRSLFSQSSPGISTRLLILAKKELGRVYRISQIANDLFRSFFSLYSPALTDSSLLIEERTINIISNMMFLMKQIHYGTLMTKAPFPCDTIIGIYRNKEELFDFVRAKEDEENVIRALDRHDIDCVYTISEKARDSLSKMEQQRADYLLSLPSHFIPFTCEGVLTRLVSRGIDCLEKKKQYPAACNWINFILKHPVIRTLIPHAIGALYERLTLDLHHHCHENDEAIDEINKALNDEMVPDKNRLALEERGKRIMKDKWITRMILIPATEISIEGETLGRDLGDERKNRFVKKTSNGDIDFCSVEEVALNHFLANGMEDGVHSEGEIWHQSFKLLFYDVIYDKSINNAWMCELQTSPLDLEYSLYSSRKESFDSRLEWLKSTNEDDRINAIREQSNISDMNIIHGLENFILSCPLDTLIGVCDILMKEHRHRRSGFPDLVLWNTKTKTITVCEVKGPDDTLSTKQKLWLDFFMKQSSRVQTYLCRVTASGRKRIQ